MTHKCLSPFLRKTPFPSKVVIKSTDKRCLQKWIYIWSHKMFIVQLHHSLEDGRNSRKRRTNFFQPIPAYLCENFVQTAFKQRSNSVQTAFKQRSNSVQTAFKQRSNSDETPIIMSHKKRTFVRYGISVSYSCNINVEGTSFLS